MQSLTWSEVDNTQERRNCRKLSLVSKDSNVSPFGVVAFVLLKTLNMGRVVKLQIMKLRFYFRYWALVSNQAFVQLLGCSAEVLVWYLFIHYFSKTGCKVSHSLWLLSTYVGEAICQVLEGESCSVLYVKYVFNFLVTLHRTNYLGCRACKINPYNESCNTRCRYFHF